jgi:hypothetical protein
MSIIYCIIVSIELKKEFNFKMQRPPIAFLFFSLETKRISYIEFGRTFLEIKVGGFNYLKLSRPKRDQDLTKMRPR